MTSELDPGGLARMLASPERRRVFAAIVLGAGTPADIAEATDLSPRQVSNALDRLNQSGVVISNSTGASIDDAAFVDLMRRSAPPPARSEHADQPADVAAILDKAIVDGRLAAWPAKRSRRLVVLNWLAQGFEPGIRYPEKQVNLKLRQYGDDVATMRRYLVDERFLDREKGVYWRSGGTVDNS